MWPTGTPACDYRAMKLPAVCLMILLQTTPLPGRWEKVDQLSTGTPINVTLRSGQILHGTFKSASPDALLIVPDTATEMALSKSDIQKVVRPNSRDRLRNGTLIGTAVGFASGFLALMAYDRGLTESGYRFDAEAAAIYTYGGLLGAGIGAVTGAVIDYSIKGDEVLFQARP